MMMALTDDAGRFRHGGVGVFSEKGLVHMAPPANRVPELIINLFEWLKEAKDHLLIRSCVFQPVQQQPIPDLSLTLCCKRF